MCHQHSHAHDGPAAPQRIRLTPSVEVPGRQLAATARAQTSRPPCLCVGAPARRWPSGHRGVLDRAGAGVQRPDPNPGVLYPRRLLPLGCKQNGALSRGGGRGCAQWSPLRHERWAPERWARCDHPGVIMWPPARGGEQYRMAHKLSPHPLPPPPLGGRFWARDEPRHQRPVVLPRERGAVGPRVGAGSLYKRRACALPLPSLLSLFRRPPESPPGAAALLAALASAATGDGAAAAYRLAVLFMDTSSASAVWPRRSRTVAKPCEVRLGGGGGNALGGWPFSALATGGEGSGLAGWRIPPREPRACPRGPLPPRVGAGSRTKKRHAAPHPRRWSPPHPSPRGPLCCGGPRPRQRLGPAPLASAAACCIAGGGSRATPAARSTTIHAPSLSRPAPPPTPPRSHVPTGHPPPLTLRRRPAG